MTGSSQRAFALFRSGANDTLTDGLLHTPQRPFVTSVPPAAGRSVPAASQRSSTPRWLRGAALAMSGAFLWMTALAAPAQALAHPAPVRRPGVRVLPSAEMKRLVGRQTAPHQLSFSPASGPAYPWEGSVGGVNTANGNKLTQVTLFSWTQRGGLPVALTLSHNSQSNHQSELGGKWTFSYDIYAYLDPSTHQFTIHWGDDLSNVFVPSNNNPNLFFSPSGIHDLLVKNVDGSYTLTKPDQTTYHFNAASLYCDTISDENANTISIARNGGGYITGVSDATNRQIVFSYDTNNHISTISDPLNRVWTLGYVQQAGGQGLPTYDLAHIQLPQLAGNPNTYSWTFAPVNSSSHDIGTMQTPGGRQETYTYNLADNSLASMTDGCGNTTTYAYANGQTVVTDANGHTLTQNYASGLLSSAVNSQSGMVTPTYDTNLNTTNVQDERGKNWAYTYDGMGNVLTASDPLMNVTTYTYSAHNKVLTKTDALNHCTSFVYDSRDNLLSVTDPLNHIVQTNTYDQNGLLQTSEDALNHTTATLGYNANGDCTSVEDANSNTTTISVNGLGWKTGTTDALSHSTSTVFDAWGRATSVTTPAGTTSTTYDADSNTLSVTDGNAHTSSTTFDNDCRPLVVTKANGDTFTYSYDAVGQKGLLSSTTDGNSHVISFVYDSLNRKSSVSYPDGTSESWTYDAASNVASHVDGNGRTVQYVYDADGQLVNVNYPTGSGAGTGISYTIDAANRRTGMTDVTGSWGYTFDAANRLTQLSAPNGTTGYGYDNANRRVSMTASGVTGSWSYSYDPGNRLLTTSNPYSETATNVFDAANRLTSTTMGNSSVVTNSYDSANRTTSVVHSTSGSATLASYHYSYDNASNVSTRTDSDGTVTTFGYDASDQLTSESRDNSHGTGYAIALAYDHNGNRTSKVQNGVTTSFSYDHHDKLTAAGSKSYGYDSNGNCTSVSVGTSVTTLSYDIENRVVGISYPGGASNSFAYNGEDLRTQKVDSTGTQNYVTDGSSPASAVLKDGNAVYTPGLSERRGTASKFYHGDALGSTRGITDSTQSVTDSALYDAFGNTVTRTGTTPTPFGFVGKAQYQSDGDSGLQLLGHRYYDPSIGRFLSSDPAQAGTNWYAYCGNNPLTKSDPLGLWETGSYGGDVWKFLKGEIGVLNPITIVKGVVGAGTHIWNNGWGGAVDVGIGIWNGLQFWNQPDLETAGASFFTDVLILAPIIKKIPNPTPIAITGPYGSAGNFTVIAVDIGEKNVFRLDYGPIPSKIPGVGGKTLPHYHRRGPSDGKGGTKAGQGNKRHRPYETKSQDTSWRDRW